MKIVNGDTDVPVRIYYDGTGYLDANDVDPNGKYFEILDTTPGRETTFTLDTYLVGKMNSNNHLFFDIVATDWNAQPALTFSKKTFITDRKTYSFSWENHKRYSNYQYDMVRMCLIYDPCLNVLPATHYIVVKVLAIPFEYTVRNVPVFLTNIDSSMYYARDLPYNCECCIVGLNQTEVNAATRAKALPTSVSGDNCYVIKIDISKFYYETNNDNISGFS